MGRCLGSMGVDTPGGSCVLLKRVARGEASALVCCD
jgi:hypothetical protein